MSALKKKRKEKENLPKVAVSKLICLMLPSTQSCMSGELSQNHTMNNIVVALASHNRIWKLLLIKRVTIKWHPIESAKAQGQADRYMQKADLPWYVGYISSELGHLGQIIWPLHTSSYLQK